MTHTETILFLVKKLFKLHTHARMKSNPKRVAFFSNFNNYCQLSNLLELFLLMLKLLLHFEVFQKIKNYKTTLFLNIFTFSINSLYGCTK